MSLYPVVILAGGVATRLRPLTASIPKALVEVGGQPFIAQQLRLLHSRGIRSVIVSAWYKAEMLPEAIGDGKRFEMDVEYVFDGERPLGTGGAVRRALDLLTGPFFVMYGDSYLPCDFAAVQAFFDRHDRLGLMAVFRNQSKWDASNVELKDGQIVRYDKKERSAHMQHIDYGLGLFRHAAFAHLKDGQQADLTEIYDRLLAEGQLLAFEVKQRFYEIGSFDGLHELDQLLSNDPSMFLRKEER
jgi:MurNAc alpha-1-phosphate uridylyltransferase